MENDETRDAAAVGGEGETSRPIPPRRLRGRVQRVVAGTLVGWLRDLDGDRPIAFELFVNGRVVGAFVADAVLPSAHPDRPFLGFRIPLSRAWITPTNLFELNVLPEGRRLPGGLELRDTEIAWAGPKRGDGAPPAAARPDGLDPDNAARAMRGWSTEQIASFFGRFEADVVLPRAQLLFRQKNWDEAARLLPTTVRASPSRAQIDTLIGRALLAKGDDEDAAAVLTGAARIAPELHATHYHAAIACARAGLNEEAVAFGRDALRLAPDSKPYLVSHGRHCRRLASAIREADTNRRRALLDESIGVLARAVAIDDARAAECLLQIARSEMELDRFAEAVAALERLLALEPDHIGGLQLLSQAFVSLNQVKKALAIAERVVALDPLLQGPRFQLRSLRSLADADDIAPPSFGVVRLGDAPGEVRIERIEIGVERLAIEHIATRDGTSDPAIALAGIDVDWLLLAQADDTDPLADLTVLHRLMAGATAWAGRLSWAGSETRISFWRRDLIVNLAQSGALGSLATLGGDLDALADLVSTMEVAADPAVPSPFPPLRIGPQGGPVVVMSRYGIVKFGGGEHFLDSMARHYADMGFAPVIVGAAPDRAGEEGVTEGRAYAFVDPSPVELRRYLLRVRPRFVHVLSGLGYQLAEALEYLAIPFVYGVHFWRDCLGLTEDDTRFFAAHDREPIPRATFRYLIEQAAAVYANSDYTRDVLEQAFSVRAPVIQSLPENVHERHPGTDEQASAILGGWNDYVLLVNARRDKGFDLLVETARRAPLARFLVIASQSDLDEATAAAADVPNVHVIGHTERMDIVYSRARAVAVPSYRFVETFSRVCIEAQRYGKPVLGSTIGNVPYLLRQSGTVLPEDPATWAPEVTRIFEDEAHYARLCEAAAANSRLYDHGRQRRAVAGVVGALPSPLLIGVGSGIGNMLHVAPMIRNVARRLGRKVDLVMTEDHQSAHFLLQNDEYVNAVFSLRQEVLRRQYDVVFVTHSFGNARVPFQARRTLYSRDWSDFRAEGPFHETIYNLEAASAVLGIPYEKDDALGYYLGNVRYRRPAGPIRIGLHGGSKDGFWLSKRWPGHAELAARLSARGFEVASFGIESEHVPGTIDETGGSIAEMVGRMKDLSYFVSNDSGLMNIANALGLPVLGIFGPTNPATRRPLGPNSRWIGIQKDCAPCEVTLQAQRFFQSGECRCLGELSVDRVETAVLDHLAALGLPVPVRSGGAN